MAKVTVEIDIPNATAEEIQKSDSGWMEGENIVIDNAYLEFFPEEDSFYQFKFIKAED